jgi:hypothetical protein
MTVVVVDGPAPLSVAVVVSVNATLTPTLAGAVSVSVRLVGAVWKAPMSHAPAVIERATPRSSVAGQLAATALPIAGLPDRSASVSIGTVSPGAPALKPPLSASGPIIGSTATLSVPPEKQVPSLSMFPPPSAAPADRFDNPHDVSSSAPPA